MHSLTFRLLTVWLAVTGGLAVQAQSPNSFVGTIAGFRPESAQIEVHRDDGETVIGEIREGTIAQKIAPGSRDLNGAQAIHIAGVSLGDRVLITFVPGTQKLARIVVMPAQEIAQRNEAERKDWEKRGVAGVVAAKSVNRITVKIRTASGEVEAVVTVNDNASFRHYAPDSVKFADARPSKLAEISVGDQVRARGEKSEDGLKVAASEVVFGTFLVKAGKIVSVDPSAREITLEEFDTKKVLTVTVTPDSQLKHMVSSPTSGRGAPSEPGPGGFDINRMLERLPKTLLTDLKPGSTLVVSSTKGANANRLTAILAIADADVLLQTAAAMANNGRGRGNPGSGPGGGGMAGMAAGDLGGLGLAGIMQ